MCVEDKAVKNSAHQFPKHEKERPRHARANNNNDSSSTPPELKPNTNILGGGPERIAQGERGIYHARKAVLLGCVAVGAVFSGDQGSAGAYMQRAQMHLKDCFDSLLPEVGVGEFWLLFFSLDGWLFFLMRWCC